MNIKDEITTMIRNGGIRQIILTGAPGTGKTRMAKEIAQKEGASLGLDNKGKDIKYEFVQFHPSYDYTDFVEGLRPIQFNGKMEFAKKDGIFKSFCRKVVGLNNRNKSKAENTDLYFFIIDEINRADLSRVFGELMYCLEKDKRGEENKVKTQYQNLPTKGYNSQDNVFADGFYIPENVVIIGTMNDIDRSVESMDFALRRRFEWQEIEVNEELLNSAFEVMNIPKDIVKRVRDLNDVIHGAEGQRFGLNCHYDISQGQFANIPNSAKKTPYDILNYVWNYRIKSLLREYVRGEDERSITDFIKKCHDAFLPGQSGDADSTDNTNGEVK